MDTTLTKTLLLFLVTAVWDAGSDTHLMWYLIHISLAEAAAHSSTLWEHRVLLCSFPSEMRMVNSLQSEEDSVSGIIHSPGELCFPSL
jgi:hypothetical protein